jgi:cell wall-associated NlpC family hydrolase
MKKSFVSARVFFCVILFVYLMGCASRQPGMVRDIEVFPQDALYYLDEPKEELITPQRQAELYEDFLARFFIPWHRQEPKFTAREVFWGVDRYRGRDVYGENNLPLPPGWIDEMEQKSSTGSYPSVHIRAISVVHASMRVLPTNRPVFYSPSRPGEGFPFDYMQNTLLPAGTPVLITHASSDGAWALAETDFAAGWIRWNELAIARDDFVRHYQARPLAGLVADGVSITGPDGMHLVSGRVGMALPMAMDQKHDGYWQVLVPVRDHSGHAKTAQTLVSKKDARKMPFVPEAGNFAMILNSMMGQAYGWGGLFENRDCSSLLKDVFAGFGIFLPRNSRDQSGAGHYISLEGFSAQEKQDLIARHGEPWLTILYMPGHVMLYIGEDPGSGRVLVYHSMWGLRTWRPFREDGRWVIGRTVITSLEPGKEMARLALPHGLLLERVVGMVFPGQP